jgi:alanine racemase
MNRRRFLASAPALGALGATSFVETPTGRLRTPDTGSFDPWVEILADAIRNNVRELHRHSGCRLLAVIKNNANGIGLRDIGPILDRMEEVWGLAVARVDEALALREVGVDKPVVLMAHASPDEAELLVREGVSLSPFHDDAPVRLAELAERVGRPVPVHLYIDTGMNRVGMPYRRAIPWMEAMASTPGVAVEGTYTMFSGAERDGRNFDEVHLERFLTLVDEAHTRGFGLGLLHGAPSYQVATLPASFQLDLIRPGGAIYGLESYRTDPDGQEIMDIQPVFRLRARVARVERLETGDGVSFDHRYIAQRPTWIATLPVGHTDGYPRTAAGKTSVLIGGQLYPLIGVVSSNHTIVEVGDEKTVRVGDVATLIGPDVPETRPKAIAVATGLERDYWIMTKLNALLYRKVV